MAITTETIRKCARNMVSSCNLTPGDGVIVKGGAHAQMLLEEVALECYRMGATPSIIVTSDRFLKEVYRGIPASTLATVPKQYLAMVKAADLLISIEEIDDPSITRGFPREKLRAREKASLPIVDVIYNPRKSKKWLYAGWPTHAAARFYGVRYSEFERTIIGGLSASPSALMKTGRMLHNRLKDASWVHVWDDRGTDFRVKIEGRRRNIDDGFISQSDYDAGDRGNNLPAGELFIAPHETFGSGTLFCPVTVDRLTRRKLTNVLVEFENGMIMLDRCSAGKDSGLLRSSFLDAERVDATRFDPVRTKNVAELGVGFNPKIRKPFGYILTDEKVVGTIHLAFGSNSSYGGKSESTMHWDFVSAPGVSMEAERANGKKTTVIERGVFV